MWCSSNFSFHSYAFTPRNTPPSISVRIRNSTIAFCCPSCAARTASTIVKLLHSSTTVLAAPIYTFRLVLATANTFGIRRAVNRIGQEHAAEEHDLGDEEDPHPERRGVLLLLGGVELFPQRERLARERDQPTSITSPMTVL